MKDFLRLPFVIYRDDPNWAAPLTSEVSCILNEKLNPYFARAQLKLFVCYENGTIVSRTAVIINRAHQEKFGVKSAFFGFFESLNNPDAVHNLFEAVETYCRAQGVEVLEGPINPNHYSELGLQVNQFGTPPTFFQPYNPPYYVNLLEDYGFFESARFHTRKNENVRDYALKRYGTADTSFKSSKYTVRSFSMADFNNDLERIREVNNDAFAHNWHFLPLSKEEFLFSAKYQKLLTRPYLIKIVECQGEPVGVIHCVLDVNPLLGKMKGKIGLFKYWRFLYKRRKISTLVIFSVGIKKAYQNTRVYSLILKSLRELVLNYHVLETTWMPEDNIPAVKAARHLALKPDKEFVIYEKRINP
jgi:hypothetical protein